MDDTTLDDALPEQVAVGVKNPQVVRIVDEVVGDLSGEERRGDVHVVRQGGRRTVAAQFLGGEGVGDEIAAEPAGGLGDADAEQASLGQVRPVGGRERSLPVMVGGSGEERRAKSGSALNDRAALGGQEGVRHWHLRSSGPGHRGTLGRAG